jgi:hypothetical protein
MNDAVPNFRAPDGSYRYLGHSPTPPGTVRAPRYADASGLIPESEWREYDLWPAAIKIKDQGPYNGCNGHAAALTEEGARYVAGKPHVPLSAWFIWGSLTDGANVGSNIGDALNFLISTGAAPEADVPWGQFNPRKFSAQAKADAGRFKAEIASEIASPEEVMSAVQRLEPINLAVCVGGAFQRGQLDDEGVPPFGWGACNHAVFVGFGAKKSPRHGWLVKMANSWTTQWGLNGFCWLPLEATCRAWAFEAYHIRAASDDPRDNTNPPRLP